jgi:N-methylhydantoinase A
VIIPPGPGVLCAYGDATTSIRDEASKTFVTLIKDTNAEQVGSLLEELKSRAAQSLDADGIGEERQSVVYQADVRYTGQAFQLSITFTQEELADKGLDLLLEKFDQEHTQLFTFALEEGHEIVMLRAVVTAQHTTLPQQQDSDAAGNLADAKVSETSIFYEGNSHDAVIYARQKLASGTVVPGPAIIAEMDSTTLVLPDHSATVDNVGNLLINPNNQSEA